ncbi:SDR family NAD(P)-dependent oxidoreductase [Williamsia serinedens]|uniref:Short-chain dehydrogenase n=1 Tax=Williamsia serinedens TaxID=391736 RepID=A0ABT1H463_9NOCA|nr:glucose 1-dehydrogenase [Williamsia serinedens]MCP2161754.1 Short-chain dehydrogenase [Williamsia serinedens]
MSDIRLDGARTLVTGATRGLGADIARAFAAAGARLVLSGRSADDLEAQATSLREQFDVEIACCPADLAADDGPERLVADAVAAFDGLDVLVNNAGVSHPASVLDLDAPGFDATVAVNLRAPALLAAAVGRDMVQRGIRGSIVTVASAAALTPLAEHYAYSATKAGLVMATKVLALELGPHGIRANSVCPTVVLTDMGRRVWGDEAKAAPLMGRIPLQRFAEPHEVSDAIVWLASDAASMISGVDLPIDGGYTSA